MNSRDVEALVRKALEGANEDEHDRHEEKLGDHQAPRQQSRPIPLNADDQLAAIVLGAVNPRSNTL